MRRMNERADQFVASFQAFLAEVVFAQRRARGDEPTLVGSAPRPIGWSVSAVASSGGTAR